MKFTELYEQIIDEKKTYVWAKKTKKAFGEAFNSVLQRNVKKWRFENKLAKSIRYDINEIFQDSLDIDTKKELASELSQNIFINLYKTVQDAVKKDVFI